MLKINNISDDNIYINGFGLIMKNTLNLKDYVEIFQIPFKNLNVVKETDDGTLSLKYLNIIAILWEQNRELNNRLKALEDKYDASSIT
jgi:hypothetical protein